MWVLLENNVVYTRFPMKGKFMHFSMSLVSILLLHSSVSLHSLLFHVNVSRFASLERSKILMTDLVASHCVTTSVQRLKSQWLYMVVKFLLLYSLLENEYHCLTAWWLIMEALLSFNCPLLLIWRHTEISRKDLAQKWSHHSCSPRNRVTKIGRLEKELTVWIHQNAPSQ